MPQEVPLLDALTLNNDRHFNNLGIIINEENGTVKEAPIFDNGDSLFSSFVKFPEETIEANLRRNVSLPFSANGFLQAKELPFTLMIDYSQLYNMLDTEPSSRAIDVLRYQLMHYRDIIPDVKLSLQKRGAHNPKPIEFLTYWGCRGIKIRFKHSS